ncbi:MAG: hypothetical protein DWQ04_19795 [Chloroflexi bacterium]|nr:MAG: hypothetical protein DWQ04_19795 [Chloroflexota bacterium]
MIVHLFGRTNFVRSDLGLSDAQLAPVVVEIPPGTYQVILGSYDEHVPSDVGSQPREEWYLQLLNATDVQIAETSAIRDIPDDVNEIVEIVDEQLVLTDTVSVVVAQHAAFGDATNANSVFPDCAIFQRVP